MLTIKYLQIFFGKKKLVNEHFDLLRENQNDNFFFYEYNENSIHNKNVRLKI
jgi:hypothetical protein